MDTIYKLHGLPVSIVTDRDKIFTSHFWKDLFSVLGVTLNFTTAYHPQSDGQTERLNQCLETYLRCMTSDSPKKWFSWLPMAEYWYNTNYHTALKSTPFQALYGYAPSYLSLKPYVDSTDGDLRDLMLQRGIMLQILKENLCKAQSRMKHFAYKNRTDRTFEVGDQVYLKLQPYRQNSVHLRRHLKLSSHYFGPYTILQKVGKVAYKLDLPPDSKIHPVFHVSLLKKKLSEDIVPTPQLPDMTSDGLFHTAPAAVLDRRQIHRGRLEVEQILVQWGPDSSDLVSWEDAKDIRKKFPTFDPWGQGSLIGGG